MKNDNKKYRLSKDQWDCRDAILDDIKKYRSKNTTKLQRIKAKDMSGIYGIPEAGIRAIINYWRSQYEAICADGDGYFFADSPEEVMAWIESMERRQGSVYRAIQGMKVTLNSMNGKSTQLGF